MTVLVDQPTSAPSDKVTAATIGAGVATVAYALLAKKFVVLAEPAVMTAALPALVTLCTVVPGYLKREAANFIKEREGNWRWTHLGYGAFLVAVGGAFGYMVT